MVRKRVENVAEIRAYIKGRCKLGLSVKTIHDEISDIYGNNQMSFSQFICGSLNSNGSGINQRCPIYRKTKICSHQI